MKRKHILILGLSVVVFVVLALLCNQIEQSTSSQADTGNRYGAQVVCEKFVKKQLVAPATAKFASPDSAVKLSGDTWRVKGHLDAENRMGALLRLTYTCDVSYQGDDQWSLVDLDVVEP